MPPRSASSRQQLYYVGVHRLAEKTLTYIRREALLGAGDRVGVAVSGGSDSVGLLRLLLELRAELGIVLAVVHFNHQLRGSESEHDASFVANLAGQHKLELYTSTSDVALCARQERVSVETAARELRYGYFAELLSESVGGKAKLEKIVTGHTLDDQAETVLMRVLRGTGLRGLRGIQPRIECGSGEVIRPLLTLRRQELDEYLRMAGQSWRQDLSNADTQFTRNRVRHMLLPLVEREFNPSFVQNLSELAEIARAEEDYWENEAAGWAGTVVDWVAPASALSDPPLIQLLPVKPAKRALGGSQPSCFGPMHCRVDLRWLESEPLAVQRRVLWSLGRDAGLALEFKHIDEILRFAAQGPGKQRMLPHGWQVVHEGDTLDFRPAGMAGRIAAADYEYRFSVPGQVRVPEAGLTLEVVALGSGSQPPGYDPDLVFDPALLAKELVLRNWRPGDRFWPAHTKSPKKLKELFEEHHVRRAERGLWPVVVSGDEIVWVRGFPGRAQMRPVEGKEAVLIREGSTKDP